MGTSHMFSGAFSLQSQFDFHVFSMSQNGSTMDLKMDPSEVQNLHYAPLGRSQERFGTSQEEHSGDFEPQKGPF
jgi:hypothetical protein